MNQYKKGDPGFEDAIHSFLYGDYSDAERRLMEELKSKGVKGIQDELNDIFEKDFLDAFGGFAGTFSTSAAPGTEAGRAWNKTLRFAELYGHGPAVPEEGVYVPPRGTLVIDAVAREVEPDKRIVVVKGARHG